MHIHHLGQQWAKGAKLRVQCAVCSISLLQNESNSVFKNRILAAVSTSKFEVLYLRKLGKTIWTQFVGSNILCFVFCIFSLFCVLKHFFLRKSVLRGISGIFALERLGCPKFVVFIHATYARDTDAYLAC